MAREPRQCRPAARWRPPCVISHARYRRVDRHVPSSGVSGRGGCERDRGGRASAAAGGAALFRAVERTICRQAAVILRDGMSAFTRRPLSAVRLLALAGLATIVLVGCGGDGTDKSRLLSRSSASD